MLPAALALLSKYAVPLMATGGAIAGGQQAYKQSGGDIGATLLGAGTGAVTGGVLPGVGKKLVGSKRAQDLLGKATESGVAGKIGEGVQKVQGVKGSPLTQQILGQQLLTNAALGGGLLAGGYLVPRLAGMVGSGASNVVRPTVSVINAARPGVDPTTGLPSYGADAVPSNLPKPAGLITQQNPLESYQANLLYSKQQYDTALEALKKQTAFEAPVVDEMKRRELERQLAAAKVRNELAIQQELTLQGQRGAQALAQQGAADIGAALRQQYQYG